MSLLILRTFVNYDRKKFNNIWPWKGPVPPPMRMMSLGLRRIRSISNLEPKKTSSKEPLLKGKALCTIDLLVITSLEQIPLKLFTLYKTSNLNEEVNRTESFPSVSVPYLLK